MEKKLIVEGKEIVVRNADKLFYPDIGLTKWDFIVHIAKLAPYLLPYVRNRLLTVIRYPDGVHGDHFYQKNVPSHAPAWIATKTAGGVNYVLLQDIPTLVWLASQAALEFHTSFHLAGSDVPTELVFDLDPSVEGFQSVIEVALKLRDALSELNLQAFPKTSGATGLQVYIPIERRYRFEDTRRVGKFLAAYLQEKLPHLVTLERLRHRRERKVYVDYLQHWRGKTMIAPYSPRARRAAPVATPVKWTELERGVRPEQFTLLTIHGRLAKTGDLFAPTIAVENRQSLDHLLTVIPT